MMKGHLSRKMAAMTAFSLFCWALATLAAPAIAAAPQVRFEHWLNVSEMWHTGAINQVNSDYAEGDVVPHRIVFENFEGHVTFAFSYEYEDTAIPAYGHDYLADVNATESSTLQGGLTTQGVVRFKGMTNVTISGPAFSDHGDRVDHYYVVTAEFGGEDAYFYYGAHLAVDGDYADHLGASSWHGGNLENRFDEDGPGGPRGDRTLSMKVESETPVHPEKGRIVVVKAVPGTSTRSSSSPHRMGRTSPSPMVNPTTRARWTLVRTRSRRCSPSMTDGTSTARPARDRHRTAIRVGGSTARWWKSTWREARP